MTVTSSGELLGDSAGGLGLWLEKLASKETKARVEAACGLAEAARHGAVGWEEVGMVRCVEALLPLMKDNNSKAVIAACEAIRLMVEGEEVADSGLRHHPSPLLPALGDVLGNNNARCRGAARATLLAVMRPAAFGGAVVMERLQPAWGHKSAHAREELLVATAQGMREGIIQGGCVLSLVLPHVLRCLEDASATVRKEAVVTLEESALTVGVGPVEEMLGKHKIRSSQLKEIQARLAKIKGEKGEATAVSVSKGSTKASSYNGVRGGAAGPRRGGSPPGGNGRARPGVGGGGRMGVADSSSSHHGQVSPITLASERDVVREIDRAASALHVVDEDWNARTAALVRLEGLTLGGAFASDAAVAALRQLRDPLIAQLSDRRSSVVRQVCHLLCVMATELGPGLEQLVDSLLPALFKVVVITIQIMAESADTCIRNLLSNCPSGRLLPKLCIAASKDRSAKLRGHCMDYLLLVLEEWSAHALERSLDNILEAIRVGVSDADSEVRATARRCFAVTWETWPDQANAMMEQLDGSLQRLLAEAMSHHGSTTSAHSSSHRTTTMRRGEAAPTSRNGVARRDTRPSSAAASAARVARRTLPPPALDIGNDTRTTTAGATRPSTTPAANPQPRRAPTDTRIAAQDSNGGVVSAQVSSVHHRNGLGLAGRTGGGGGGGARRVPIAGKDKDGSKQRVADKENKVNGESMLHGNIPSGGDTVQVGGGNLSFKDLVGLYSQLKNSRHRVSDSQWQAKVTLLSSLKNIIMEDENIDDTLKPEIELVIDIFALFVPDPHAKVAAAALDCLAEFVPVFVGLLEPYLERLLPLIFPRLVDSKATIRELSTEVLTAIGSSYSPERLLPGLLRTLDCMKSVKGRVGVVEFAAHYLGGSPDEPSDSAHLMLCSQWLRQIAPMCADKSAELRVGTTQCLIAVYKGSIDDIAADIHLLPRAEQKAVNAAMAREVPQFEELVSASVRSTSSPLEDGGNGFTLDHHRHDGSQVIIEMPAMDHAEVEVEEEEEEEESTMPSLFQEHHQATTTQHSAPAYSMGAAYDRMPSPVEQLLDSLQSDTTEATAPLSDDDEHYRESPLRRPKQVEEASPRRPVGAATTTPTAPPPSVSEDPRDIPRVLTRASAGHGGGDRLAALEELATLAERSSHTSSSWIQFFPQSLMVVVEALSDTSPHHLPIRHAGFRCLNSMIISGSPLFAEYLDLLVPRLFQGLPECDHSGLRHVFEESLELLFDLVDPLHCIDALVKLIKQASSSTTTTTSSTSSSGFPHHADSTVLQPMIKMLNRSVVRLDSAPLQGKVSSVLPVLFGAFNSPSADVRKSVVFILVDMYLICGEWLTPFLASLSTSQHKLLTIYINRALSLRDKETMPIIAATT